MCEIDSKSNKKQGFDKEIQKYTRPKRRSKNLPSANCWKSPKKRKQWM